MPKNSFNPSVTRWAEREFPAAIRLEPVARAGIRPRRHGFPCTLEFPGSPGSYSVNCKWLAEFKNSDLEIDEISS